MSPKLKNNFLNKYPLLAVFLFTFICLLPAMLMRDFTPSNELRYLSIADEAISNGNGFAFYNHGQPYADKPPLYIWAVMLCRILFGQHCVFALTLLSLVPAFVLTWLMDRWVMTGASSQDRMAMSMMLLSSVMFLGTMVVIRMDMLMCMFIALALFTFWRMYGLRKEGLDGEEAKRLYRKCSWLLPVWIFLALFTKGPVGLLVPPVSILVFLLVKREWRDIPRYLGWKTWGVIAGLCLIWFTGVFIDGGVSYLDNLLFKQTVGRAVNAFTHSRPFWFYAVAILWCIAPYTILLIGGLIAALRRRGPKTVAADDTEVITAEAVRSDTEVLFLCVIATTFIMLSSFSSKLPVYLVPMIPFIVYLFPLAVNRTGARKWMIWAISIPAALLAVAGLAALLVLAEVVNVNALESLSSTYPFAFTSPVKMAAVLLMSGNALALWFLFKRKHWNLPVFMIGASLFLTVYSAAAVLPMANPYIGYKDMCKEVPSGTDVATLFVHRPENIDVYIGRQIKDYKKDVDGFLRDAADSSALGGSPFTLIVTGKHLEEFPDLRKFVYSSGTVVYVGPYCIVTRK